MPRWRHFAALRALHICGHLGDEDLYHRILQVVLVTPLPGSSFVELATHELASPSSLFPLCHFSLTYMPRSGKDPNYVGRPGSPVDEATPSGDALQSLLFNLPSMSDIIPDALEKQTSDSERPRVQSSSFLNFDSAPAQLSRLGWNYNDEAKTTKNPQFKYTFPGGKSAIRLYKPCVQAHFGLTLNFASKFTDIMVAPKVGVVGSSGVTWRSTPTSPRRWTSTKTAPARCRTTSCRRSSSQAWIPLVLEQKELTLRSFNIGPIKASSTSTRMRASPRTSRPRC